MVSALALGCGDSEPTQDSAGTAPETSHRLDRDIQRLRHELERERERLDESERDPDASGGTERPLLAEVTELESELSAEIGIAFTARGDVVSVGSLTGGSAWSTIKVPIALRVLEDSGGPAGLDRSEEGLIERALTASDNEAAATLFAQLQKDHGGLQGAADAVTEILRRAGDTETVVSTEGRDGFSPYGQTDWSAENQVRFMAHLGAGCVAEPATTDYVLELMGRVTSDTWGLGSIEPPARWKGGWGPDSAGRYLVRQMGLMQVEGHQVAVALAVEANDGSFESGQVAATRVAQWVAANAEPVLGVPC